MAARAFPLQALFQSIHQAVVKATRVAQAASLNSLKKDYFEPVLDDEGNATGVVTPKIMRMVLPHQEGAEIKQATFDVPMMALVKHQSMTIDTLEMEFEVELHGLEDLPSEDNEGAVLSASTSGGAFSNRKTIAKVHMTFKGDDPPEGVMRLNDKVLKTFPQ